MEKHNVFVILFLVVIIFYFMEPVPLCKIGLDEETKQEDEIKAIYTGEEILEIKMRNVTLLNTHGESMIPTIQDNSYCLCVKKDSYDFNDIIFFTLKRGSENLAILHRIVLIEGNDVITKGDNNDFLDPKIRTEDIFCHVPTVPKYKTLIN